MECSSFGCVLLPAISLANIVQGSELRQGHFIVVYGVNTVTRTILVADPAWRIFKKASTQSEAALIRWMVRFASFACPIMLHLQGIRPGTCEDAVYSRGFSTDPAAPRPLYCQA